MPGEVTKVAYNPETGILEGAGYKALVIYQDWMDPDGAEIVLEYAKQGMPVVILENAARISTFTSDVSSKGNKLGDIMDEMKALGLFEHEGVALHPGDAGMAAIAHRIVDAVTGDNP